jgi:putative flavoprotein involved in K+ transport
MRNVDTIVIGAGQAGLAASRCLTDRGEEHVVLERGRVAERWRGERWDSLTLLTPNWMNTLPGQAYQGPDPDGFLPADRFADSLDAYARTIDAPVIEYAPVRAVDSLGGRFVVTTDGDRIRARSVVVATGWCDRPAVPAMAANLDRGVAQTVPSAYRNPASLPPGGVLVVGASATGVQLAQELAISGRDVVLAVGSHSRVPRSYRGRDIYWWLRAIGSLDRSIDELPDPVAARHEPSLQLIGRDEDLDLAVLQGLGVRLAGHLSLLDGSRAEFADDLGQTVGAADARLRRVLADVDRHVERQGWALPPAAAVSPVRIDTPVRALDLRRHVRTVVWATGFRRSYPWLHVPAFDERGEIRQYRGVTPVPGLYVLGQRFQHYRSSNFIGGVGRDAAYVADHIAGRTRRQASA